jgi:cytochrome P450
MAERPYINLLDPQFYVYPWDAYKWMREHEPVFWDPVQKLWGISRFEDLMYVEKHPERYTSYHGSRPKIDQTANTSMIDQDDPLHQKHRSLIHRRFTPRAVLTQEDEVREVGRRAGRVRRGGGPRLAAARDHDRPPAGLRPRGVGAGAVLVGDHDVPGRPDRPRRR